MTGGSRQPTPPTFDRPTDSYGHRSRWTADEVEDHRALEEEFRAWASNHGAIWFDSDTRLAQKIAFVLDITLEWTT